MPNVNIDLNLVFVGLQSSLPFYVLTMIHCDCQLGSAKCHHIACENVFKRESSRNIVDCSAGQKKLDVLYLQMFKDKLCLFYCQEATAFSLHRLNYKFRLVC